MHASHGRKHGFRRQRAAALPLQLVCKYVKECFRIRTGIQVPAILLAQHLLQFAGVGEIAVVAETNAVRGIYVERLRFIGLRSARGRIATMADAHVALEPEHVLLLKHILHQPVILALAKYAVVIGHDAGGVLPPVLQHDQRVIDSLVYWLITDNADNPAHVCSFLFVWGREPLAGPTVCLWQQFGIVKQLQAVFRHTANDIRNWCGIRY